ncbi:hypothetical protein CKO12_11670 [Chromatium okenii]|nr:hypothetical protein [Chromatium okenii]
MVIRDRWRSNTLLTRCAKQFLMSALSFRAVMQSYSLNALHRKVFNACCAALSCFYNAVALGILKAG